MPASVVGMPLGCGYVPVRIQLAWTARVVSVAVVGRLRPVGRNRAGSPPSRDSLSVLQGILAPVPVSHDDKVTYADFVQRVRRHAASSMLPQVAALASRYPMPQDWLLHPGGAVPTPWSLAEITRVSFMSDENDGMPATEQDILDCCAAYLQLLDPAL